MARRYEYKRMSGIDFRSALEEIDMPPLAFARIFGFDDKRIRLWMNGEQDIPIWVFPVVQILKNVPGAIPEARQAAAEMIQLDTWRPEDGYQPFLVDEA